VDGVTDWPQVVVRKEKKSEEQELGKISFSDVVKSQGTVILKE
jgi:hypothetical protein